MGQEDDSRSLNLEGRLTHRCGWKCLGWDILTHVRISHAEPQRQGADPALMVRGNSRLPTAGP